MSKILHRIENGEGRPVDIDLVLDVADNISPGLSWPPGQSTICLLGPSAVAPVLSLVQMYRDEVEAHISGRGCPYRREREAVHA